MGIDYEREFNALYSAIAYLLMTINPTAVTIRPTVNASTTTISAVNPTHNVDIRVETVYIHNLLHDSFSLVFGELWFPVKALEIIPIYCSIFS
jgi:hypothetical protein